MGKTIAIVVLSAIVGSGRDAVDYSSRGPRRHPRSDGGTDAAIMTGRRGRGGRLETPMRGPICAAIQKHRGVP